VHGFYPENATRNRPAKRDLGKSSGAW
jgi:hypothetical protein